MPVAPEMRLLKRKIGGDDKILPRRRPQYRAVVTNAHTQHAFRPWDTLTDCGDQ
jgi:hypothetical protein